MTTNANLTTETAAAMILRDLRAIEAKYPGRRISFPASMWNRHVRLSIRSTAFRRLSMLGLIERSYASPPLGMWMASAAGLALQDSEIDAKVGVVEPVAI